MIGTNVQGVLLWSGHRAKLFKYVLLWSLHSPRCDVGAWLVKGLA